LSVKLLEYAIFVLFYTLFIDPKWVLYLPEFQNQGIGTAIVLNIIKEAHQGCKPVHLRVLTSSPAKFLDERLGFVVVQIAPERYFMEYFDQ
jgi:GNAT superfamily N-acetyltransferase